MGCRITFFSSGVALTLDADHASCASFQFQQKRKSATSHEFHGIAEFSRRSAPPHLLAPGQQLTSKSITAASRKRPKRRYGAFAIIFSAPPEDAFIDIKFFFFLVIIATLLVQLRHAEAGSVDAPSLFCAAASERVPPLFQY